MSPVDPQPTFEVLRERLTARDPAVVDGERAERARRAAVAVILIPGEQGERGPELLLIRRAECEGDPWSGHMGLPGGRMDREDADLLATARRETHEELAVDLPETALLGRLDDLHPVSVRLPSIVVRPFVFGLQQRPEIVSNHEVAYHLWTPAPLLAASHGRTVVRFGDEDREMPSYSVGEDVVWGITQRILAPLLEMFG